jgi:gamma-glutamyltranspeptidase/glutathione hydrolase
VTGEIEIEEGFSSELIKKIEMRGHKVVLSPSPIGGSQAIWIDYKNGTLIGGSDPRKDGCAQGY